MSYLEELLPEFRKGAKIRRKDWDCDVFIYFDKDEIYWKDSGAWKNGEIASTKDLVSIFTIRDNDWELYQGPEPDWDYIINNKCLCCFWDNKGDEKQIGYLVGVNNKRFYLEALEECFNSYTYCRPVRRDEVIFYEDRKDD